MATCPHEFVLKLVKTENIDALKNLLCHESYTKEFLKNYTHKKTGDSILSYACREGNLSLVQHLHKNCGIKLGQSNFEGKRALHEASQFGKMNILEYLLLHKVELNPIKRADW